MQKSLLAALACLLSLTGCAMLTHESVDEFGTDVCGFPYYQGAHYLLIYGDGKGTTVTKLLFLPDRNLRRVAKPTQFLSRLDSTLKFSKGVLTQSTADADSTALPKAVIAALEKAAAAAMNARIAEGYVHPAPYLYKVKWDGTTLELIGGRGTAPIQISL